MKDQYPYFNPLRKNHLVLMELIEQDLERARQEVVVLTTGERTQNIFRGGKYYMTINWSLI